MPLKLREQKLKRRLPASFLLGGEGDGEIAGHFFSKFGGSKVRTCFPFMGGGLFGTFISGTSPVVVTAADDDQ